MADGAPPRRRGARGGVWLGVAVLLLLLGIGEGVARWLWSHAGAGPAPPRPEAWRELPELRGVFQLARPDLRGIANGVLWETDEHGLRGPSRRRPKPPGVFRVALIGDSIAAGMGVAQADTYAARLERSLDDTRPQDVEVVNFGLAGLNAPRVVERFERLAPRYEPDLIVYGYTLNDIEGPAYRRTATWSPLAWLDSPLRLARFLGPRIDELRELWLRPRGSYVFELDDNYFENPEAWAAVGQALDRLAARARADGVCAVVFVHPRLHALGGLHPFHRHYEQVLAAAGERGLHGIASWPAVRGRNARSLHVSIVDPHPNAEGHRLLHDALLAGLDELPAGCWRDGAAP